MVFHDVEVWMGVWTRWNFILGPGSAAKSKTWCKIFQFFKNRLNLIGTNNLTLPQSTSAVMWPSHLRYFCLKRKNTPAHKHTLALSDASVSIAMVWWGVMFEKAAVLKVWLAQCAAHPSTLVFTPLLFLLCVVGRMMSALSDIGLWKFVDLASKFWALYIVCIGFQVWVWRAAKEKQHLRIYEFFESYALVQDSSGPITVVWACSPDAHAQWRASVIGGELEPACVCFEGINRCVVATLLSQDLTEHCICVLAI